MEKTNKQVVTKSVIKCPYCGMEYSPSEIFMPGQIVGKPKNLVKDALGKIIYQDWEEGDEAEQEEHYVCDGCGKSFTVKPVVTYTTSTEAEETDFTELSSSLLD